MHIHISTGDGEVPIYQQIVNQVKYLVAAGRLAPGEELPPIRVLAERLIVNPNTVARAYRELEAAGLVTKRRTAGTFVSDAGSPLAQQEKIKILSERYQRAKQILTDNREALERIAVALLERETLEQEDLVALLEGTLFTFFSIAETACLPNRRNAGDASSSPRSLRRASFSLLMPLLIGISDAPELHLVPSGKTPCFPPVARGSESARHCAGP